MSCGITSIISKARQSSAIVTILVSDGTTAAVRTDVNLRMVKDGLAWHYKRYDSTKSYADAEAAARTAKLGLWKDPDPVPPHEFRKAKRKMV